MVPSSLLGLHLQDRKFRCCLCYLMGVPLHNGQFACPECRGSANPFGDHQVGCGDNGDRISRHNAIRDVVFNAAQSAALAPSKEAPNLVPDSSVRPADILLPNWNRGRPAAVDVHVISPLQQQTLAEAASTPGHALQVGVHRKLVSILSACRSVGVEFVPIVIETLGDLSEDTISTIRAIGRAVGQRSGTSDPSRTSKQLCGRVAIALWRVTPVCGYTGIQPFPLPWMVLCNFGLPFSFYCALLSIVFILCIISPTVLIYIIYYYIPIFYKTHTIPVALYYA